MDVDELVERWRRQAEEYERDGAYVPAASLLRRVANELHEYQCRRVTTVEAARLSGYTPEHLAELAREGKIDGAEMNGGGWTFPVRNLPHKPTPKANAAVSELAARRNAG